MISLVAAMGRNNVMGAEGHLPWGHSMPSDIKRYTDLIENHTIVMGTNTFKEADHARTKSKVMVLSRGELKLPDGVGAVHSVDDILALDSPDKELFITGGGGVFHLMIDYADKLYLTVIEEEFDGDVFFPEVNLSRWKLEDKKDFQKDERNKYNYSFLTYLRI